MDELLELVAGVENLLDAADKKFEEIRQKETPENILNITERIKLLNQKRCKLSIDLGSWKRNVAKALVVLAHKLGLDGPFGDGYYICMASGDVMLKRHPTRRPTMDDLFRGPPGMQELMDSPGHFTTFFESVQEKLAITLKELSENKLLEELRHLTKLASSINELSEIAKS